MHEYLWACMGMLVDEWICFVLYEYVWVFVGMYWYVVCVYFLHTAYQQSLWLVSFLKQFAVTIVLSTAVRSNIPPK